MKTGTGKTITAIERFKQSGRTKLLVICPRSVVEYWKQNIRDYVENMKIADFRKPGKRKAFLSSEMTAKEKNDYLLDNDGLFDAVVVNFEIVAELANLKSIISDTWMIVVDEIHRIKSWGTSASPVKVTRFVVSLGELTDYKMGLTATPTQGNYGGYLDYYPQLKFLGYTDMSYYEFYNKYVNYTLIDTGAKFPIKKIVGYRYVNEINDLLKCVAIRYSPVYDDFPPEHITVKIPRAKDYARLSRERAMRVGDAVILMNNQARVRLGLKTMTTGVVVGLDALSHQFEIPNNTNKLDWLEDFLTDVGEPVVIFYWYKAELRSLQALMERLKKTYMVVNSDNSSRIKDSDCDIYLGQFQAMGVGIDGLHLKSHIEVFFSMPESSLLYIQAIGRIDRIGQDKVPMYYYLVMEKTIDEDIMKMIDEKTEFSEEVLDLLNLEVEDDE